MQVLYELLSAMLLVSMLYAGACVWGQGTCNPWQSTFIIFAVIHLNNLYGGRIWRHLGFRRVAISEGPVFVCSVCVSLRSASTDPWHLELLLVIWDCSKSASVLYRNHFLLTLLTTSLFLTRLFYCSYMQSDVCGCCCQLWAPLTVENLGEPFCHPVTKIFSVLWPVLASQCTGTIDLFANWCEFW